MDNNKIKNSIKTTKSLKIEGVSSFNLRKFDKALEIFEEIIKLDPDDYFSHYYLGKTLQAKKNFLRAKICFQKTILLNPQLIQGYIKLFNYYLSSKQLLEAGSILLKGIDNNPDTIILYLLFSKFCFDQRFYHRSEVSLKKIIFLVKNSIKVTEAEKQFLYEMLGNIESVKGNHFKSIKYYQKSFNIKKNKVLLTKIIFGQLFINFNLKNYLKLCDLFRSLEVQILNEKKIKKNFTIKKPKLKIGFMSAHLRTHAVGYQILPIIDELSKKKDLQLYAYYNHKENDISHHQFKKKFYKWNDVSSLNDESVFNLIKSHNIDILFELDGYTAESRINILINKPVPIQIAWCGYLASTGIKEIDYIVVDPHVAPNYLKTKQFSEKKFKMPHVWSILTKNYEPFLSNEIPATKNGYVTFGCFNNHRKINQEVISTWSKILLNVPNSKLLLKSNEFKDSYIQNLFYSAFEKEQINKTRLIFEGPSERKILLEKYNEIDIVLDTFPYNGGTTNLEAAWMCVPILTLKGDKFVSLCGTSINKNLKLDNWIAKNNKEYYLKGIKFAKNLVYLQEIKKKMIAKREKCILFDKKKFANNFYKKLKKLK